MPLSWWDDTHYPNLVSLLRCTSLVSAQTGNWLADCGAIRRVSAGSDVLDPEGNDITATKLAVDCRIEHGKVWPSIWSFVRINRTCLGRSGGFAPSACLCGTPNF